VHARVELDLRGVTGRDINGEQLKVNSGVFMRRMSTEEVRAELVGVVDGVATRALRLPGECAIDWMWSLLVRLTIAF
jgi:hypothetical protein